MKTCTRVWSALTPLIHRAGRTYHVGYKAVALKALRDLADGAVGLVERVEHDECDGEHVDE